MRETKVNRQQQQNTPNIPFVDQETGAIDMIGMATFMIANNASAEEVNETMGGLINGGATLYEDKTKTAKDYNLNDEQYQQIKSFTDKSYMQSHMNKYMYGNSDGVREVIDTPLTRRKMDDIGATNVKFVKAHKATPIGMSITNPIGFNGTLQYMTNEEIAEYTPVKINKQYQAMLDDYKKKHGKPYETAGFVANLFGAISGISTATQYDHIDVLKYDAYGTPYYERNSLYSAQIQENIRNAYGPTPFSRGGGSAFVKSMYNIIPQLNSVFGSLIENIENNPLSIVEQINPNILPEGSTQAIMSELGLTKLSEDTQIGSYKDLRKSYSLQNIAGKYTYNQTEWGKTQGAWKGEGFWWQLGDVVGQAIPQIALGVATGGGSIAVWAGGLLGGLQMGDHVNQQMKENNVPYHLRGSMYFGSVAVTTMVEKFVGSDVLQKYGMRQMTGKNVVGYLDDVAGKSSNITMKKLGTSSLSDQKLYQKIFNKELYKSFFSDDYVKYGWKGKVAMVGQGMHGEGIEEVYESFGHNLMFTLYDKTHAEEISADETMGFMTDYDTQKSFLNNYLSNTIKEIPQNYVFGALGGFTHGLFIGGIQTLSSNPLAKGKQLHHVMDLLIGSNGDTKMILEEGAKIFGSGKVNFDFVDKDKNPITNHPLDPNKPMSANEYAYEMFKQDVAVAKQQYDILGLKRFNINGAFSKDASMLEEYSTAIGNFANAKANVDHLKSELAQLQNNNEDEIKIKSKEAEIQEAMKSVDAATILIKEFTDPANTDSGYSKRAVDKIQLIHYNREKAKLEFDSLSEKEKSEKLKEYKAQGYKSKDEVLDLLAYMSLTGFSNLDNINSVIKAISGEVLEIRNNSRKQVTGVESEINKNIEAERKKINDTIEADAELSSFLQQYIDKTPSANLQNKHAALLHIIKENQSLLSETDDIDVGIFDEEGYIKRHRQKHGSMSNKMLDIDSEMLPNVAMNIDEKYRTKDAEGKDVISGELLLNRSKYLNNLKGLFNPIDKVSERITNNILEQSGDIILDTSNSENVNKVNNILGNRKRTEVFKTGRMSISEVELSNGKKIRLSQFDGNNISAHEYIAMNLKNYINAITNDMYDENGELNTNIDDQSIKKQYNNLLDLISLIEGLEAKQKMMGTIDNKFKYKRGNPKKVILEDKTEAEHRDYTEDIEDANDKANNDIAREELSKIKEQLTKLNTDIKESSRYSNVVSDIMDTRQTLLGMMFWVKSCWSLEDNKYNEQYNTLLSAGIDISEQLKLLVDAYNKLKANEKETGEEIYTLDLITRANINKTLTIINTAINEAWNTSDTHKANLKKFFKLELMKFDRTNTLLQDKSNEILHNYFNNVSIYDLANEQSLGSITQIFGNNVKNNFNNEYHFLVNYFHRIINSEEQHLNQITGAISNLLAEDKESIIPYLEQLRAMQDVFSILNTKKEIDTSIIEIEQELYNEYLKTNNIEKDLQHVELDKDGKLKGFIKRGITIVGNAGSGKSQVQIPLSVIGYSLINNKSKVSVTLVTRNNELFNENKAGLELFVDAYNRGLEVYNKENKTQYQKIELTINHISSNNLLSKNQNAIDTLNNKTDIILIDEAGRLDSSNVKLIGDIFNESPKIPFIFIGDNQQIQQKGKKFSSLSIQASTIFTTPIQYRHRSRNTEISKLSTYFGKLALASSTSTLFSLPSLFRQKSIIDGKVLYDGAMYFSKVEDIINEFVKRRAVVGSDAKLVFDNEEQYNKYKNILGTNTDGVYVLYDSNGSTLNSIQGLKGSEIYVAIEESKSKDYYLEINTALSRAERFVAIHSLTGKNLDKGDGFVIYPKLEDEQIVKNIKRNKEKATTMYGYRIGVNEEIPILDSKKVDEKTETENREDEQKEAEQEEVQELNQILNEIDEDSQATATTPKKTYEERLQEVLAGLRRDLKESGLSLTKLKNKWLKQTNNEHSIKFINDAIDILKKENKESQNKAQNKKITIEGNVMPEHELKGTEIIVNHPEKGQTITVIEEAVETEDGQVMIVTNEGTYNENTIIPNDKSDLVKESNEEDLLNNKNDNGIFYGNISSKEWNKLKDKNLLSYIRIMQEKAIILNQAISGLNLINQGQKTFKIKYNTEAESYMFDDRDNNNRGNIIEGEKKYHKLNILVNINNINDVSNELRQLADKDGWVVVGDIYTNRTGEFNIATEEGYANYIKSKSSNNNEKAQAKKQTEKIRNVIIAHSNNGIEYTQAELEELIKIEGETNYMLASNIIANDNIKYKTGETLTTTKHSGKKNADGLFRLHSNLEKKITDNNNNTSQKEIDNIVVEQQTMSFKDILQNKELTKNLIIDFNTAKKLLNNIKSDKDFAEFRNSNGYRILVANKGIYSQYSTKTIDFNNLKSATSIEALGLFFDTMIDALTNKTILDNIYMPVYSGDSNARNFVRGRTYFVGDRIFFDSNKYNENNKKPNVTNETNTDDNIKLNEYDDDFFSIIEEGKEELVELTDDIINEATQILGEAEFKDIKFVNIIKTSSLIAGMVSNGKIEIKMVNGKIQKNVIRHEAFHKTILHGVTKSSRISILTDYANQKIEKGEQAERFQILLESNNFARIEELAAQEFENIPIDTNTLNKYNRKGLFGKFINFLHKLLDRIKDIFMNPKNVKSYNKFISNVHNGKYAGKLNLNIDTEYTDRHSNLANDLINQMQSTEIGDLGNDLTNLSQESVELLSSITKNNKEKISLLKVFKPAAIKRSIFSWAIKGNEYNTLTEAIESYRQQMYNFAYSNKFNFNFDIEGVGVKNFASMDFFEFAIYGKAKTNPIAYENYVFSRIINTIDIDSYKDEKGNINDKALKKEMDRKFNSFMSALFPDINIDKASNQQFRESNTVDIMMDITSVVKNILMSLPTFNLVIDTDVNGNLQIEKMEMATSANSISSDSMKEFAIAVGDFVNGNTEFMQLLDKGNVIDAIKYFAENVILPKIKENIKNTDNNSTANRKAGDFMTLLNYFYGSIQNKFELQGYNPSSLYGKLKSDNFNKEQKQLLADFFISVISQLGNTGFLHNVRVNSKYASRYSIDDNSVSALTDKVKQSVKTSLFEGNGIFKKSILENFADIKSPLFNITSETNNEGMLTKSLSIMIDGVSIPIMNQVQLGDAMYWNWNMDKVDANKDKVIRYVRSTLRNMGIKLSPAQIQDAIYNGKRFYSSVQEDRNDIGGREDNNLIRVLYKTDNVDNMNHFLAHTIASFLISQQLGAKIQSIETIVSKAINKANISEDKQNLLLQGLNDAINKLKKYSLGKYRYAAKSQTLNKEGTKVIDIFDVAAETDKTSISVGEVNDLRKIVNGNPLVEAKRGILDIRSKTVTHDPRGITDPENREKYINDPLTLGEKSDLETYLNDINKDIELFLEQLTNERNLAYINPDSEELGGEEKQNVENDFEGLDNLIEDTELSEEEKITQIDATIESIKFNKNDSSVGGKVITPSPIVFNMQLRFFANLIDAYRSNKTQVIIGDNKAVQLVGMRSNADKSFANVLPKRLSNLIIKSREKSGMNNSLVFNPLNSSIHKALDLQPLSINNRVLLVEYINGFRSTTDLTQDELIIAMLQAWYGNENDTWKHGVPLLEATKGDNNQHYIIHETSNAFNTFIQPRRVTELGKVVDKAKNELATNIMDEQTKLDTFNQMLSLLLSNNLSYHHEHINSVKRFIINLNTYNETNNEQIADIIRDVNNLQILVNNKTLELSKLDTDRDVNTLYEKAEESRDGYTDENGNYVEGDKQRLNSYEYSKALDNIFLIVDKLNSLPDNIKEDLASHFAGNGMSDIRDISFKNGQFNVGRALTYNSVRNTEGDTPYKTLDKSFNGFVLYRSSRYAEVTAQGNELVDVKDKDLSLYDFKDLINNQNTKKTVESAKPINEKLVKYFDKLFGQSMYEFDKMVKDTMARNDINWKIKKSLELNGTSHVIYGNNKTEINFKMYFYYLLNSLAMKSVSQVQYGHDVNYGDSSNFYNRIKSFHTTAKKYVPTPKGLGSNYRVAVMNDVISQQAIKSYSLISNENESSVRDVIESVKSTDGQSLTTNIGGKLQRASFGGKMTSEFAQDMKTIVATTKGGDEANIIKHAESTTSGEDVLRNPDGYVALEYMALYNYYTEIGDNDGPELANMFMEKYQQNKQFMRRDKAFENATDYIYDIITEPSETIVFNQGTKFERVEYKYKYNRDNIVIGYTHPSAVKVGPTNLNNMTVQNLDINNPANLTTLRIPTKDYQQIFNPTADIKDSKGEVMFKQAFWLVQGLVGEDQADKIETAMSEVVMNGLKKYGVDNEGNLSKENSLELIKKGLQKAIAGLSLNQELGNMIELMYLAKANDKMLQLPTVNAKVKQSLRNFLNDKTSRMKFVGSAYNQVSDALEYVYDVKITNKKGGVTTQTLTLNGYETLQEKYSSNPDVTIEVSEKRKLHTIKQDNKQFSKGEVILGTVNMHKFGIGENRLYMADVLFFNINIDGYGDMLVSTKDITADGKLMIRDNSGKIKSEIQIFDETGKVMYENDSALLNSESVNNFNSELDMISKLNKTLEIQLYRKPTTLITAGGVFDVVEFMHNSNNVVTNSDKTAWDDSDFDIDKLYSYEYNIDVTDVNAVHQNSMLDVMKEGFNQLAKEDKLFMSISTDSVKELVEKTKKKTDLSGSANMPNTLFSSLNFNKNASIGKNSIDRAANFQSLYSVIAKLRNKGTGTLSKLINFEYKGREQDAFKILLNVFTKGSYENFVKNAIILQTAVDNTKNPLLGDLGISPSALNEAFAMISDGKSMEWINNFMNNYKVKQIYDSIESAENISGMGKFKSSYMAVAHYISEIVVEKEDGVLKKPGEKQEIAFNEYQENVELLRQKQYKLDHEKEYLPQPELDELIKDINFLTVLTQQQKLDSNWYVLYHLRNYSIVGEMLKGMTFFSDIMDGLKSKDSQRDNVIHTIERETGNTIENINGLQELKHDTETRDILVKGVLENSDYYKSKLDSKMKTIYKEFINETYDMMKMGNMFAVMPYMRANLMTHKAEWSALNNTITTHNTEVLDNTIGRLLKAMAKGKDVSSYLQMGLKNVLNNTLLSEALSKHIRGIDFFNKDGKSEVDLSYVDIIGGKGINGEYNDQFKKVDLTTLQGRQLLIKRMPSLMMAYDNVLKTWFEARELNDTITETSAKAILQQTYHITDKELTIIENSMKLYGGRTFMNVVSNTAIDSDGLLQIENQKAILGNYKLYMEIDGMFKATPSYIKNLLQIYEISINGFSVRSASLFDFIGNEIFESIAKNMDNSRNLLENIDENFFKAFYDNAMVTDGILPTQYTSRDNTELLNKFKEGIEYAPSEFHNNKTQRYIIAKLAIQTKLKRNNFAYFKIYEDDLNALINKTANINTDIKYYKGDITPSENTIFVFGSNPIGINGNISKGTGGAALQAQLKFGVQQNEKMDNKISKSGMAYGLVTVTAPGQQRSLNEQEITNNIKKLYETAEANPNKDFKVAFRNTTQKSLNGYTGYEMMKLFKDAGEIPNNIVFSEEWIKSGTFDNLNQTEESASPKSINDIINYVESYGTNISLPYSYDTSYLSVEKAIKNLTSKNYAELMNDKIKETVLVMSSDNWLRDMIYKNPKLFTDENTGRVLNTKVESDYKLRQRKLQEMLEGLVFMTNFGIKVRIKFIHNGRIYLQKVDDGSKSTIQSQILIKQKTERNSLAERADQIENGSNKLKSEIIASPTVNGMSFHIIQDSISGIQKMIPRVTSLLKTGEYAEKTEIEQDKIFSQGNVVDVVTKNMFKLAFSNRKLFDKLTSVESHPIIHDLYNELAPRDKNDMTHPVNIFYHAYMNNYKIARESGQDPLTGFSEDAIRHFAMLYLFYSFDANNIIGKILHEFVPNYTTLNENEIKARILTDIMVKGKLPGGLEIMGEGDIFGLAPASQELMKYNNEIARNFNEKYININLIEVKSSSYIGFQENAKTQMSLYALALRQQYGIVTDKVITIRPATINDAIDEFKKYFGDDLALLKNETLLEMMNKIDNYDQIAFNKALNEKGIIYPDIRGKKPIGVYITKYGTKHEENIMKVISNGTNNESMLKKSVAEVSKDMSGLIQLAQIEIENVPC